MRILEHLRRPPWRTILLLIGVLSIAELGYFAWSPGKQFQDGRHDRRQNGIWLQHGWLGEVSWFERNPRDKSQFRDEQRIRGLAELSGSHGITHLFPHVCPCDPSGALPPVDPDQTERFLNQFKDCKVIPWIGGVLDAHCFPESVAWRSEFVASTVGLLRRYPGFSGIQVNIEPMPSGDPDFLLLLGELRAALPAGKILSVAAYPPPTRWHPVPEVHWDEPYFRQVASLVDLMVPMMYDTAIQRPKLYRHLIDAWTKEVISWSGEADVLLGVPAYSDSDVGYHHPSVENLANAVSGIHAGLSGTDPLPENYLGIAIYCEWEMDDGEWETLARTFGR